MNSTTKLFVRGVKLADTFTYAKLWANPALTLQTMRHSWLTASHNGCLVTQQLHNHALFPWCSTMGEKLQFNSSPMVFYRLNIKKWSEGFPTEKQPSAFPLVHETKYKRELFVLLSSRSTRTNRTRVLQVQLSSQHSSTVKGFCSLLPKYFPFF